LPKRDLSIAVLRRTLRVRIPMRGGELRYRESKGGLSGRDHDIVPLEIKLPWSGSRLEKHPMGLESQFLVFVFYQTVLFGRIQK
jgi:hypothetical protein